MNKSYFFAGTRNKNPTGIPRKLEIFYESRTMVMREREKWRGRAIEAHKRSLLQFKTYYQEKNRLKQQWYSCLKNKEKIWTRGFSSHWFLAARGYSHFQTSTMLLTHNHAIWSGVPNAHPGGGGEV